MCAACARTSLCQVPDPRTPSKARRCNLAMLCRDLRYHNVLRKNEKEGRFLHVPLLGLSNHGVFEAILLDEVNSAGATQAVSTTRFLILLGKDDQNSYLPAPCPYLFATSHLCGGRCDTARSVVMK